MENFLKITLPLAIDCLELSDLDTSDNMGFVNAYIVDSNNPCIWNQIFLLYRNDVMSAAIEKRKLKFKYCKNIYNIRNICLKGVSHTVYSFTVNDRRIFSLYEGLFHFGNKEYLYVHKFWNFTDDFMNELLCNRSRSITDDLEYTYLDKNDYMSLRYKYAALPKEDQL